MKQLNSAGRARARRAGVRAARAVRGVGALVRRAHGRFAGVIRDAGLATAEYAVVMIAAVGFAGLLVVILRSSEIRETLTNLVRDALSV
ncbi:DUF4244 domain-containing protein [Cellulomonas pakistanensis]|uniref:DUF4244 domain-containing protein n=1 Tax=Cellulomonas pakistanensis TaxID=992287 RepID=A0A919P7V0_9CELL|nr:DUF4244 domain-containing protein [Cellulomonas pakistanensis]GIG35969.1 hypothetical protein Cpa01nite_13500 [Cellulomonas pakistanensis]